MQWLLSIPLSIILFWFLLPSPPQLPFILQFEETHNRYIHCNLWKQLLKSGHRDFKLVCALCCQFEWVHHILRTCLQPFTTLSLVQLEVVWFFCVVSWFRWNQNYVPAINGRIIHWQWSVPDEFVYILIQTEDTSLGLESDHIFSCDKISTVFNLYHLHRLSWPFKCHSEVFVLTKTVFL